MVTPSTTEPEITAAELLACFDSSSEATSGAGDVVVTAWLGALAGVMLMLLGRMLFS